MNTCRNRECSGKEKLPRVVDQRGMLQKEFSFDSKGPGCINRCLGFFM